MMKIRNRTLCLLLASIIVTINASGQESPVFCQDTNANADIVIMMDVTGSNTAANIEEQKQAIQTFIASFNNVQVTTRPYIGVGTFNHECNTTEDGEITCLGDAARIIAGGSLTNSYGELGGDVDLVDNVAAIKGDGLIGRGLGGTDLNRTLRIAQMELDTNGSPDRPDYIVIISDGNPNLPGFSRNNPACDSCVCPEAETIADDYTTVIENDGTQIIAIQYNGNGVTCADEDGEIAGLAYMRDQIASQESFFFPSFDGLSGIFRTVAQDITCQDDGNACTINFCNTEVEPAVCDSRLDTTDLDEDQVLDCEDQCQGANDSELGQVCVNGLGVCQATGTTFCSLDSISCDSVVTSSGSEEVCDGSDNDCDGEIDEGAVCCQDSNISSTQLNLDGSANSLRALVNRAANRLAKFAINQKQRTFARNAVTDVDKLYTESWEATYSLPSVVLSCTAAAISCSNVTTFTSEIETYNSNTNAMDDLLLKLVKRIRRARGKRAKETRLLKRGDFLLESIRAELANLPTQTNVCS